MGNKQEWKADRTRIQSWIEHLSQFNATPGTGNTRQLFTQEDIGGRRYIIDEMKALGLEVSCDDIGNIYGVCKGSGEGLAPVWSGSHIDTVYQGGAFDGISGVVCAMEAVRMIREKGIPHKRDLVVTVFSGEEPARFGMGCIGSRVLSGHLTTDQAKKLMDPDGISLYEAAKQAGYTPDCLERSIKKPGDVYASVELHIEQNALLEREGLPLGVVTSICAPSNFVVEVTGRSAHAGGMSMEDRRDAFTAACEMALAVEECGRNESQSEYSTATVGSVKVEPNQSNIIPGKVEFTIDIRDAGKESKDHIGKMILERMEAIAEKRGVQVSWRQQNNDAPMPCDLHIMEKIERYSEEMGIPYKKMVSGAFHDSMFLGEFCPVGMIFVPSRDGLSHCPEEWTDYQYLETGSQVLAAVLAELANEE